VLRFQLIHASSCCVTLLVSVLLAPVHDFVPASTKVIAMGNTVHMEQLQEQLNMPQGLGVYLDISAISICALSKFPSPCQLLQYMVSRNVYAIPPYETMPVSIP